MIPFACENPPSGRNGAVAAALQGHLPALATDRLILRSPRVADFEAFAEIACSERGRFFGGPFSREDAWAEFAGMTGSWLLHGHGLWTIGAPQGVVGFVLLGFEPGDREPELGFLMTAAGEGQGYAAEAARAALGHAFDTLGWSTCVSYVDPANARAIALAERLGAVRDTSLIDDTGETLTFRHLREALA